MDPTAGDMGPAGWTMGGMRSLGIVALVAVLLVGAAWLLAGGGRGTTPRRTAAAEVPAEGGRDEIASLQDPGVLPQSADAPDVQREELTPVPEAQPQAGERGPCAWLVRVVALETGEPIPDVHVMLMEGYGTLLSRHSPSRQRVEVAEGPTPCSCPVTDADGRVELEARAGEESTIVANVLETVHASREVRPVPALEREQRRELEIKLRTRDDLRWFARVLDDATDAPLPGAIAVWDAGSRSAVGAADGMLVIDFAAWQTTRLEVEVPGYLKQTVTLERGHDGPERAFPVRMLRPAALEVRVRDGLGAPRPDLRVEVVAVAPPSEPEVGRELVPSTEAVSRLAAERLRVSYVQVDGTQVLTAPVVPPGFSSRKTTDGDGACSFEDLPPNQDLSVAVRAGLGQTQRRSVMLAPGERRVLEFEMGTGCKLQGVAVDEQGEPMAKLDLWRLADGAFSGAIEPQHERSVVDKARTDAEGRFVFAGVPAGEWWIGPAPYHREAGILPVATRVAIPADERVQSMKLVCRSVHSALYIRGQVLGSGTGQAFVTAEQDGVRVSAECRQAGRFVVGPLEKGEWLLHARESGGFLAPSESVRADAGQTDVILRLTMGGSVIGTVLDERGTRVPGAEVVASPDEHGVSGRDRTDEYGFFSISGLRPGVYYLRASSGASAGLLGPLTVEAGSSRERLEVHLALAAELRVRAAGRVQDDLVIRLLWNETLLAIERFTGGELRATLPPGVVEVQLLRRSGEGLVLREEQRVTLRAGETTLVELDAGAEPGVSR